MFTRTERETICGKHFTCFNKRRQFFSLWVNLVLLFSKKWFKMKHQGCTHGAKFRSTVCPTVSCIFSPEEGALRGKNRERNWLLGSILNVHFVQKFKCLFNQTSQSSSNFAVVLSHGVFLWKYVFNSDLNKMKHVFWNVFKAFFPKL